MFYFVDWLGCVKGEGILLVIPSLILCAAYFVAYGYIALLLACQKKWILAIY